MDIILSRITILYPDLCFVFCILNEDIQICWMCPVVRCDSWELTWLL